MRQIGSLDNEIDARRFGAYLLTRGVKNSVEEAGGGWAVWVENDDLLDRGRAELDAFRANPADARYDAAVGEAERVRKAAGKAEQRRREQFVDVRTRWARPGQLARPVTIVLVAASIVIAVGTRLGQFGPTTDALFIAPFGADERWHPDEGLGAIAHGQVWRLVTPIFLHFTLIHLLFNMFWLVDLGSMVETRRGSWFLLVFVLTCAVASNVAQFYWPPSNPAGGGMSGVNYALFGYAWITGRLQPHLGIGVSQQTVTIMLAWLVFCMVGQDIIGPVGNVAHAVGLAAGVAFAYVPYAVKRLRRGR
jgi:GlpG protein